MEFLGLNYPLKDKMNDIIANYKNSKILDLTGAIFEYDLNYFFLSGEKIVQGKRTGLFSKFNNLNKARTQSNLKTNYFETGPLNPNVCYELYFCTYENGDMTSATFIGYSDGCTGGTGGGSVSGYDSASAYQSGGGLYAGNPPPAPLAQNITVDHTITDNPKLNCINDKLVKNTVYNDFLKKFKDNSTYNLTIKAAPINSGDLGVTKYDGNLQNGNVSITINSNQIGVASIDLATTFIHEAFHAFIDQNLIQRHLMGTNVFNQTYAATFDQYVTAQVDSVRSARMALNQPYDPQTVSHNIIAANIDRVANGIKQYAELAWPALKTNPDITFANYRATAWASEGLVGSTSYAKEFDTPAKVSDLNQNRNLLTQNTTNDCN